MSRSRLELLHDATDVVANEATIIFDPVPQGLVFTFSIVTPTADDNCIWEARVGISQDIYQPLGKWQGNGPYGPVQLTAFQRLILHGSGLQFNSQTFVRLSGYSENESEAQGSFPFPLARAVNLAAYSGDVVIDGSVTVNDNDITVVNGNVIINNHVAAAALNTGGFTPLLQSTGCPEPAVTDAAGLGSIVFPQQFPNGIFTVQATLHLPTPGMVAIVAKSTSGFDFEARDPAGAVYPLTQVWLEWLAYGL